LTAIVVQNLQWMEFFWPGQTRARALSTSGPFQPRFSFAGVDYLRKHGNIT
jgi:hypothetical protein